MTNRGWGLMWQMDTKQLREEIEKASRHFHQKYEIWPNLVTVNDLALQESGIVNPNVKGERMTPRSHIHLWGIPNGQ